MLFESTRLASGKVITKQKLQYPVRILEFLVGAGGFEPAACGFWRQLLCQLSEYGMKKSAPARLGKDAGDIGVLLPHFFVDRAFVANLMSFIPPAGWGLFRRQHQAVISDVRNIPAKAVRNLMAEDRAENLWVRNRSCIKNHAVSSPRRFVFQHRLASLPYR